MRYRAWVGVVVLSVSVLAGCSSADDDGAANPVTTTSAAPKTPERFAVDRINETYVDTSRPTPANGDIAGKPDRTLPTNILYPGEGGPYPLVVFSHGLGGSYEYPEGKRSATATPTAGLTDGQLVTVSWKGFNRNGTINIVQCSGDGKTGGTAACDLNDAYILRPDPTGEGTAQIDMVVGTVGSGVCDATHPCMIVVNDSALTAEEAIIRIPVTFAG